MQHVNASLTLWTQRFEDRAGRFIRQAQTILLRAVSNALAAARSFYSRVETLMDDIDRRVMERVFARQMAVRRMFLTDPRDPNSEFTKEGRMVLAHWARQARVLSPDYSSDLNAEMKGMQKMFAIILSDIFNDVPNFVQAMAFEEQRQAEEIISA